MTIDTMTYVMAVENAINGNLDPVTIEKLTKLKASLEKRNASKSGKPTKAQVANAEIGESVLSAMEFGVDYTTAEIGKLVPALEGANPQKIAPIMAKLVKSERVTCEKVKGKNVYRLA